ncbi:hypothetical protein [Aliiruegeria lutimaris]|uniref:Uncharacterized protein n=1 Tax=Aliiruegeria lutimaris TaxID=571298 RepID=A0A1G8Q7F5_9RHOB|nr:hypothetical protein [Aliiruegeria lutimaris]SDJ00657.1 hypothetical protein SAMN04488026_101060 [Aliiruegeria lutimaris]
MQIMPALRTTAATVTLMAGLFSAGVRFGPMVAPEQHEAAIISLAAAFGEDIGPVKAPPQAPVLIAY